jgi:hypothetical protein
MNEHFVCIKVDREERPDIDQVYMMAVQMIWGNGGWPLHAFALPDGRPFFGGTYFNPAQWTMMLQNIVDMKRSKPQDIIRQAEQIATGVMNHEFNAPGIDTAKGELADVSKSIASWEWAFDREWGGMAGAPKFPVPVNFFYLLRYVKVSGNKDILDFIILSLRKMAYGGIYDQLGGGFARYSTDAEWRLPHFEKMLYDNAQLISLYAEAYQLTKHEEFRSVVYETMAFVERELTSPEGAFYAALDADSEGEEGKFYTWTIREIQEVLAEDENIFANYYFLEGVGSDVLHRRQTIGEYAAACGIDTESLRRKLDDCRRKLFAAREKRVRPGLDDKTLTSWNALMAKACFDAYAAFEEPRFFETGKKNLDFLLDKCRRDDGGLWHRYKDGKAGITGFLEDYAFLIEALLAIPAAHDNRYIYQAKTLMHLAMGQFYDPVQGLFYFTSSEGESLFARKKDIVDNVIPSANSSLCRSLFRLGQIFGESSWMTTSRLMTQKLRQQTLAYPSNFSNWGIAFLESIVPFYTVAIAGPTAREIVRMLNRHYLPFIYIAASTEECYLPLLQNKYEVDNNVIHICNEEGCLLPTSDVNEALQMLGEE